VILRLVLDENSKVSVLFQSAREGVDNEVAKARAAKAKA
jgi:hypothetical protein